MIYENTGFDLDKNMKLREAARSIDTESLEALKPLVAGFGPDSADQNRTEHNKVKSPIQLLHELHTGGHSDT
jgi:hypothetical protein